MTIAETLTVAELETSLTGVLERVRAGGRFTIERDGEAIATLSPASDQPVATLRDLAKKLAVLPPLDDDFGADIEAIREIISPAKDPEWPD